MLRLRGPAGLDDGPHAGLGGGREVQGGAAPPHRANDLHGGLLRPRLQPRRQLPQHHPEGPHCDQGSPRPINQRAPSTIVVECRRLRAETESSRGRIAAASRQLHESQQLTPAV